MLFAGGCCAATGAGVGAAIPLVFASPFTVVGVGVDAVYSGGGLEVESSDASVGVWRSAIALQMGGRLLGALVVWRE